MQSLGNMCRVWALLSVLLAAPCLAGENNAADIVLSPPVIQGDVVSYQISVSSAVRTVGFLVMLRYSTDTLEFLSWEDAAFLDNSLTYGPLEDEETGRVLVATATRNRAPTTESSGVLGTARFLRTAPGDAEVVLIKASLCDDDYVEDRLVGGEFPVQCAPAIREEIPVRFALRGVGPNPAVSNVAIRYDIPRPGAEVQVKIYDVTGREVQTLVNEPRVPGYHSEIWDLTNNRRERVAPGVYFCRMEAGSFKQTKKLILLK